jgi:spermidine synthase
MAWYRETLHPYIQESVRIEENLHEGRTAYQAVHIFRNASMGIVMALDGVIQTTEADEFIYHEMLAHLPILAHGRVRRVLVIGGGDGGCIEEVLKHAIERVVMVELDAQVVALAKQHLTSICRGAFEDPRLELIIADGAEYVARTDERFDLVIVDSTDPIGPGIVLFEAPFYAGCQRCLDAGGILITQNGVPFFQQQAFDETREARAELFRHSGYYFATVPTYFGGEMAFGWASDAVDLAAADLALIRRRYRDWDRETRYYNPEIHRGAFAIPNYLKVDGPEAGAKA